MKIGKDYKLNEKINKEDYLVAEAVYFSVKRDQQKSTEKLDSFNRTYNDGKTTIVSVACEYVSGEKDKAFSTLQSLLTNLTPDETMMFRLYFSTYYLLSPLYADPRFEEIKKEIGWKP